MKSVKQMRRLLGRKSRRRTPWTITHYFRVTRASRRPIKSCPIPTSSPVYSSSGSNSLTQVCAKYPLSDPWSCLLQKLVWTDTLTGFMLITLVHFGWWSRLFMLINFFPNFHFDALFSLILSHIGLYLADSITVCGDPNLVFQSSNFFPSFLGWNGASVTGVR